ncbi:hypothetical protein KAFR_0B01540 [Kazachstania africana CBS 2517]|uniref:Aminodeoxychorismate lyase n=1 Tax=Kazachstania africana (strain ATCC 22294 / BCRC 22015 / CBS 2517 / CECT 1963 / NBRC 1671 / NRRL Y-8276) TaxID=1071382 RepID=H2AQ03_KAZAF|nr:hypothetical protein KAFR_0B01540 [Kazachstania africana CBS 2517]CCF56453.1 hypothetical protein KAFR_0B01540 [Kazachstania africana CBS 2517]
MSAIKNQGSCEEFEILDTLRYDSNFSLLVAGSENLKALTYSEVDNMLQLEQNESGYNFFGNASIEVNDLKNFTEGHEGHGTELLLLLNAGFLNSPKLISTVANDKSLTEIISKRFLFLRQHLNRINAALGVFEGNFRLSFGEVMQILIDALMEQYDTSLSYHDRLLKILNSSQVHKVRLLVTLEHKVKAELHPLPFFQDTIINPTKYFINSILSGFLEWKEACWDLFLDGLPTAGRFPFSTFKTTARKPYDEARNRLFKMAKNYRNGADDTSKCEVLLYNEKGEIMEGSITNIAVLSKNKSEDGTPRYITPYLSSGCLCGTMRYYLLKKGLISEGHVMTNDIKKGDTVLLFNGVMGCVKGIIRE